MFTGTGMTSPDAGTGRTPGFKIKILRGTGLVSFLVICIVILSNVNLRPVSAAVCDCVACHGADHHGTTTWPGCNTSCHSSPPATGAHVTHSAPISNTTYGDTVTSTSGGYQFGCGHCHSMEVSKHRNGAKDVDLTSATGIGQTGTQVCSECHGSNGPHGTCDSNDCLSCHNVAQGATPAIVPATNHHSGACATCHYAGAADGRAPHDTIRPLTTNASCLACHTTVNQGTNHHIGTCTTCHAEPGVSIRKTCTNCHGNMTLYPDMGQDQGIVTCTTCHTAPTKAAAFAACVTCHTASGYSGDEMQHNRPRPNFVAPCDTTTSNKINFDASSTTCLAGYTCSYSWDFGQSGGTTTNAATASPTHTYTSSGTYPVTLTVTAAAAVALSGSVMKSVPTCIANQAPTCGRTAIVYSPNNTVSFTDTSTDDGVGGVATVSVNWGDTKTDLNKPLLSPFSHTYSTSGTYLLIQSVQDAAGAIIECPRQYVTLVPAAGAKFKVIVNMSKAVPYTTVKVMLNGSIKSQGSTGAAGLTWTSASLPANANYTLSVMKPGKTFSCNGATVDLSTGNQTAACTVTP